MLVINDEQFFERAEIIREKGTNRSQFYRGEADKYGWMDIGSSFLPSDLIAAFLFAQLESLEKIQNRRKDIWNAYHNSLISLNNEGKIKIIYPHHNATQNGHIFAFTTKSPSERTALIKYMKNRDIHPVFHYLSLHKSPFYLDKHDGRNLQNSDFFSEHLLRLPLYYELNEGDLRLVTESIVSFYNEN